MKISIPNRLISMENVGGLSVVIEYTDTKGNSSQRLITCWKLSVRADKRIFERLLPPQEGTTGLFRIDRITDIFDAQTGESLSPAQAFFATFKPDETSASGLNVGTLCGSAAPRPCRAV